MEKVIVRKAGLVSISDLIKEVNAHEQNGQESPKHAELVKEFKKFGLIDPKEIKRETILLERKVIDENFSKEMSKARKSLGTVRNFGIEDIKEVLGYLKENNLKARLVSRQKVALKGTFNPKPLLVEMNYFFEDMKQIQAVIESGSLAALGLNDQLIGQFLAGSATVKETALGEEILTIKVVTTMYATNSFGGGEYKLNTWLANFKLTADDRDSTAIVIDDNFENDLM